MILLEWPGLAPDLRDFWILRQLRADLWRFQLGVFENAYGKHLDVDIRPETVELGLVRSHLDSQFDKVEFWFTSTGGISFSTLDRAFRWVAKDATGKQYGDGSSLSRAIQASLRPDATTDVDGEKWSAVLGLQRRLEDEAVEAGIWGYGKPVTMWPAYMLRQRGGGLGMPPSSKEGALFAFMRNVGVDRKTAASVAATGKRPPAAAGKRPLPTPAPPPKRKVMVVSPAVGRTSAAKLVGNFATLLKPGAKKPGAVKTTATKPRDLTVTDGEKQALSSAAIVVGGLVVVAGIYVATKKLGGP